MDWKELNRFDLETACLDHGPFSRTSYDISLTSD